MLMRQQLVILLLFVLGGCASQNLDVYLDNYESYRDTAYVIDHGLHTALVVRAEPMLRQLGLSDTIFSKYRYLEIGRGEASFYRASENNLLDSLKALLVATPAIMHISAYSLPPAQKFPLSDTLEIKLSSSSMKLLMNSIVDSFALQDGVAVDLGESRNPTSHFFKASGSYHLFYTCNNWTAEKLYLAGYPIGYRRAIISSSVMSQVAQVNNRLEAHCVANERPGCNRQIALDAH